MTRTFEYCGSKVLAFFFLWALFGVSCWAQDTITISKISELQVRDDPFYEAGLFPSHRLNIRRKSFRQDNNIFFTALTIYTLQGIRSGLAPSDKIILDTISLRAMRCYGSYRNRHGDITYNFWQTKKDIPFPNSRILSRIAKMRLPDDLDDTAIIYLTQAADGVRDSQLKKKMQKHATKEKIKTTLRKYRKAQVYGTWFGEKMPQELDICVMANTMVFVLKRSQPIDSIDFNTLSLIEEMVMQDDHLNYPHIISPQYKNSSIILYHVARLLDVAGSSLPNRLREKVVGDLQKRLGKCKNEMERVILLTSLYRLGVNFESQLDLSRAIKNFDTFYWFRANLMSGKPIFVKRLIGRGNWLDHKFRSQAYYWSLLMEFQFYRKRAGS